jgi:alpha-glucosidase
MSPVFRTHSDHGDREPWKYSATAKKLFRKQTKIRYSLAPFFYTLAREAHETGMPIARPLYLEYNDNDGGALWRKHQYTLGRDLLVIPAEGPVDKHSKMFRKRAYFPNGNWIGLETDEMYHGMRDGYIDIPLDRIPTYVREGAIIPCQKVGGSLGTAAPKEIHFDFYPSAFEKSEFTLYEDDGKSKDYERGRFAKTTVTGQRREHVIEMSVSAPRGTYEGMPKARTYVLRSRVERPKVLRAEAKVGKGAWRPVSFRIAKECLAGTIKSRHSFCEVRVRSSSEPVSVRIVLA